MGFIGFIGFMGFIGFLGFMGMGFRFFRVEQPLVLPVSEDVFLLVSPCHAETCGVNGSFSQNRSPKYAPPPPPKFIMLRVPPSRCHPKPRPSPTHPPTKKGPKAS